MYGIPPTAKASGLLPAFVVISFIMRSKMELPKRENGYLKGHIRLDKRILKIRVNKIGILQNRNLMTNAPMIKIEAIQKMKMSLVCILLRK